MAKPKGGARPGAGNPGYGKQMAVREGVERLTPRWFAMIEEMLDAKPDDGLSDTVKELAKEFIARDSYYGKELIKWMARGAIEDRKFALDQLGKLMGKLMPTEMTASFNLKFNDFPEDKYKQIIQREGNRIKVSGD